MHARLHLSPAGHLYLVEVPDVSDGVPLAPGIGEAFGRGSADGVLALTVGRGAASALSPDFAFWREFGRAFLAALARAPESGDLARLPDITMPAQMAVEYTLAIPAMPGAEYATPAVFGALWDDMLVLAQRESTRAGGCRAWLAEINPALHLVGRVTFHLAENKRNPDTPFAFMATYTHKLSARDTPLHLPLARALQEFAGAKNQTALRSLLEPVQRAAEQSAWARELLNSRAVFEAQAWMPAHAYAFLRELPALEASGIITRIPNWWKNGRGTRPQVSVRIGEKKQAGFSASSLLDFDVATTLDGQALTQAEWKILMGGGAGLVFLRGQWVEVDSERLRSALEHWKRVESGELGEGLSFAAAMRLIAGTPLGEAGALPEQDPAHEWSQTVAGKGLRETLERLRAPESIAGFDPGKDLRATLRPYQVTGAKWLWFLQRLGLGACLADDMGLGKTIQVIAVLLQIKRESESAGPALLIAPASLLANWKNELTRFAPGLRAGILHASDSTPEAWRDAGRARAFLAGKDVVLTTYGLASRLKWLAEREWRLLILDVAQAIKNPAARQTKAVKQLRARARIALSGTPIENRLGDLWSLYDFLNPGLLGGAQEFGRYVKRLQEAEPVNFAPLRALTRPYLLRRLKTDKAIIADLPDKVEVTAWCSLGKRQAALYQTSVDDLARQLSEMDDGIQRRGMVLAFLMRFKQICNHPSQWLGDGAYDPTESGKFSRLSELGEEIASRGEKALVFTQFREMTEPLALHLRDVFGRPGLTLHGATAVKERQRLVADFQREGGPPFFVLSLKAGGVGLNLTAANHVIHFDRWWNPAVENQATDRAFRIGQMRNVLVHKFVCQGTIEERIDAMINDKRALSDQVLDPGAGAEKKLTEMTNDELLRFVALDLKSAVEE